MLIVVVLGSACTRAPSLPGPGAVDTASSATASGPCGLLTAQELDVAVNAPVELVDPALVRPLLAGMQMCSLRQLDAGANWGLLAKGANKRFHQYQESNAADVESLSIDGHDAVWDEALRILIVLDGARAFGIQLSIDKFPVPNDKRKAHLKETAEQMAELAVKRMPDAKD